MSNKDFIVAKSDSVGSAHVQVPSLGWDINYILPAEGGTFLTDITGPGATGATGDPGAIGATGATGQEGAPSNMWAYGVRYTHPSPWQPGDLYFNGASPQNTATEISLSTYDFNNNQTAPFLANLAGATVRLEENEHYFIEFFVNSLNNSFPFNLYVTPLRWYNNGMGWVDFGDSDGLNFLWYVQGATGTTGAASTVAGPSGNTGATGPQGMTGNQGNQGFQGVTGVGVTGATGSQGNTGNTGAGVSGATGAQGNSGNTGNTGAGVTGATGADSTVPGPAGQTGATGMTGGGSSDFSDLYIYGPTGVPATMPASGYVQVYAYEIPHSSSGGDLIPVMTNFTAPSGTVTVSTQTAGDFMWGWCCFDDHAYNGSYPHNDAADGWWTDWYGSIPCWVKYQFDTPQVASVILLRSAGIASGNPYYPNGGHNSFTLEGSNDDSIWDLLISDTTGAWIDGVDQTFTFSNTTPYFYYRYTLIDGKGTSPVYTLNKLQLQGAPTPLPSTVGLAVRGATGTTGSLTITTSGDIYL